MQRFFFAVLALSLLNGGIESKATQKQVDTAHHFLRLAVMRSNRCLSHKQCAIVATSAQACGDPTRYIAYATTNSNYVPLILNLANLTSTLGSQLDEEDETSSSCETATSPSVKCMAGKCIRQRK